jgi:hypothetical protein
MGLLIKLTEKIIIFCLICRSKLSIFKLDILDLFDWKKRNINVLIYINKHSEFFTYSINARSFFPKKYEDCLNNIFTKNYSKRNTEDYCKILSALTILDSDYMIYRLHDMEWVIWKKTITIEKFEEAINYKPKLIKKIKDLYDIH